MPGRQPQRLGCRSFTWILAIQDLALFMAPKAHPPSLGFSDSGPKPRWVPLTTRYSQALRQRSPSAEAPEPFSPPSAAPAPVTAAPEVPLPIFVVADDAYTAIILCPYVGYRMSRQIGVPGPAPAFGVGL